MHIAAFLSIFTPVFVLILGLKQRFSILWTYAALGFSFDVLGAILKYGYGYNNHWLSNVFVLSEFICFSIYFKHKHFSQSFLFPFFIILGAVAFSLQTGFNSLNDFNSYGYCLCCIYYTVICLYGFYKLLTNPASTFIHYSSGFWANAGIFIYASSLSLLFLYRYNLQGENLQLFNQLWIYLFLPLNIIKYLAIGISLKLQK